MHDEGIGPIWGGIWKIYTFGQLDSYLFSFLFAYEHIYLQHIYLKIQKNMMVITDFEIFYFTSSTKMEHELKLNSLCRLWGVKIPINSKSHSKESFKSAITSLYNIDIDSLNIHPSKICTSCRLRLTRYCSQTQDATWINLPVLHEFLPHSDNCDIWYVKPGRQKKVLKRNLSVPSQSTKKSFIRQEHSYHSVEKDSQDRSRPLTSPDCPSSSTSSSSTDHPSCSSTCSIPVPEDSCYLEHSYWVILSCRSCPIIYEFDLSWCSLWTIHFKMQYIFCKECIIIHYPGSALYTYKLFPVTSY